MRMPALCVASNGGRILTFGAPQPCHRAAPHHTTVHLTVLQYRATPSSSCAAPGSAPVVDPCGQAGGKFTATPVGGDSVYTATQMAQMGDMGSLVLRPVAEELQPTWVAGQAVDVAWGMRYSECVAAN